MNIDVSEYETWRKKVFKYARIFIILAFIVEIITLGVNIMRDNIKPSYFLYTMKNIILPFIINVLGYFICNFLSKSNKDENFKNTACLYSLIISATVIVVFHSLYPQIAMAFCLVLAIASMFGEKRLLNLVLIHGLIAILLSFIIEALNNKNSSYVLGLLVEQLISVTLFSCTYLGGKLLLKNNIEKMEKISKYRNEQSEYIELLKYDSLTGLYNNNALKTTVSYSLKYLKKDTNLMIAIIDLDNFKKINDTYGHVFGDQVLTKFSEIIRDEVNDNVLAGRLGGEEFAILFSNLSKNNVELILRRMLYRLSSYFNEYNITFSAGVAKACLNDDVESIIERADVLLYDVKRSGKNNIKFENR